jgi:hypothetical protein
MTNPSSEYVNERYALEAEERRRREMLERRAKQTPAERWQEVKENMGALPSWPCSGLVGYLIYSVFS